MLTEIDFVLYKNLTRSSPMITLICVTLGIIILMVYFLNKHKCAIKQTY